MFTVQVQSTLDSRSTNPIFMLCANFFTLVLVLRGLKVWFRILHPNQHLYFFRGCFEITLNMCYVRQDVCSGGDANCIGSSEADEEPTIQVGET